MFGVHDTGSSSVVTPSTQNRVQSAGTAVGESRNNAAPVEPKIAASASGEHEDSLRQS